MKHKPQNGDASLYKSMVLADETRVPTGWLWLQDIRFEALANLAHKFRTPLQVLIGYLDALREELPENPPSRERRMVDRMNAVAGELTQIVENVMEFVLAGEEAPGEDLVPTFDLLDEVMPLIEAANQEKRLEFRLDLDHAPSVICASHRPLRMILANLAVNAIRFTPTGVVKLAIREVGPAAAPMVECELSDTGPGISRENIDYLLAPSSHFSPSSAGYYRGIGLGLAVIKRNVAALNGHLEVDSEPGRGSRVLVRIPVRPAHPRTAEQLGNCPVASPAER